MSEEDYTPEESTTPATRRRVARRGFAQGAAEAMGGTDVQVQEEEEEVQPAANRVAPNSEAGGLKGGWGAGQRVIDQTSTFANRFIPGNDETIIKFLDDGPYVSYARHWVERVTQKGKTTIPFVCLESVGKSCPLCDVGDKVQAVSAFNVAVLEDDGSVTLKTWDVGVKIFQIIHKASQNKATAPLTRRWYNVQTAGTGQQKSTTMFPMSEEDIKNDFGITPASDMEIGRLGKYDTSIVEIPKTSTLSEIADEMSSADDYS